MLRKCHLNTCSVGIATQDPELREKFTGKPEDVVAYFTFVAEGVRAPARRSSVRARSTRSSARVELPARSASARSRSTAKTRDARSRRRSSRRRSRSTKLPRRFAKAQPWPLDDHIDHEIIDARAALERHADRDRAADRQHASARRARCSRASSRGATARKGLPDGSIHVRLTGSAGQSFGAFLAPGVTLELCGDANDYIGKGMSGGRIIV